MNGFQRVILRKFAFMLVSKGVKHLPLALSYVQDELAKWKTKVDFQDGEIKSLFPVIDYDRKKFFIYIFRINENETENKKISVSRVVLKYDLKQYFDAIVGADEKTALKFVDEKVTFLLDQHGEEEKKD